MNKINEAGQFNIDEMAIDSIESGDINDIVLMEQEIFSDAWPREAFLDILADPGTVGLISRWSGTIIGYAIYNIQLGEAHLANIAVSPNFRGKSIAKNLLSYILKAVKTAGCENIFLDVRPSNKTAIALYEKFGFIELYQNRNYYNSPSEDALVMVKNLREEF